MKDVNTLAGLWYTVSSAGACTVTAAKDGKEFVLAELKAAGQRAFQAIGLTVQVSDDAAVVLRADSSAALAAMALDGGGGGGTGVSITIDQAFSATSENAQSGKAVASALATIPIRCTSTDLGTTSVTGTDAIALGKNAVASEYNSVALGFTAKAYSYGTSIGGYSFSRSQNSTAVGWYSQANAIRATAVGSNTKVTLSNSVAIGENAKCENGTLGGIAIGSGAETVENSTAIGYRVKIKDRGCVSLSAFAETATNTQTILYLISAGSSLANTYEAGAACLGYVVKQKDGTIIECGTRKLSELLTSNTAFAPAAFGLDDEPTPGPFLPTGIMEPMDFPELNETEQEQ